MPTQQDIARALERVIDPELGIDVVTLGLIYGISVSLDEIRVAMATTSVACPMSSLLLEGAARAVSATSRGLPVAIDHTVEPPWDPGMMDPRAMGMFAGWR